MGKVVCLGKNVAGHVRKCGPNHNVKGSGSVSFDVLPIDNLHKRAGNPLHHVASMIASFHCYLP